MDKPIRILQIGMHDKIGGIEKFLMNYYNNIDRSKVQFDFINPYTKLCFEEEIKKNNGYIYNVSNFKKHPFKYYRELVEIIKKEDYKIVHVNLLSTANIIPILAAKKCKVKNIIAHSHNNGVPSNIIRKILNKINKKILLKNANIFWACSQEAGKWMFEKQKFTVINNGIEIQKFFYNDEYRNIIRKKYNIKEGNYVIGHVGRFEEQKNHMFIIDLITEIQKIDNNFKLLLIGEGNLEKQIKDKVKELKLENNVIFGGVVNDVEKYYSAMDVFILPSKFEGLGIVNVEAQAASLPCLVSSMVPKNVKLSDNFFFFNLLDNKNEWIDKIMFLKKLKIDRKFIDNRIFEYDIEKLSLLLEKKYLDLYK